MRTIDDLSDALEQGGSERAVLARRQNADKHVSQAPQAVQQLLDHPSCGDGPLGDVHLEGGGSFVGCWANILGVVIVHATISYMKGEEVYKFNINAKVSNMGYFCHQNMYSMRWVFLRVAESDVND